MGSSESRYGYHVLEVHPNSPASEVGLLSFTDYIIQVNGISLKNDITIQQIIKSSLNCKLFMKVYNVVTKEVRDVEVIPRDNWGGEGALGSSIRWEEIWEQQGLRITEIYPDSPASQANLQVGYDYILGTFDETFRNIDQLHSAISTGRELELFVLNHKTMLVRKIKIQPVFKDGYQYSIGLQVAEGYLNLIVDVNETAEEVAKVEPVIAKEEIPPPPMKTQSVQLQSRYCKIKLPPSVFKRGSDEFAASLHESPYIH